jgi:aminoglycoside phosphotransferase family enzyme/predicted kinase
VESSESNDFGSTVVLETHISSVVLVGDRALKFMKPIANAFIDQSTVEKRRAACEQELRLNRRIAPDVYLGIGHVLENDETTDCFLVMRRLPLDRRLSALVASPAFPDHVRAVARSIATFHANQPPNNLAATLATADAMAQLWSSNIAELRELDDGTLERSDLERVERQASRYVRGRESLFAGRIARGYARDGHGDLLADDIFMMDDGPRVLDCLAFDERLRCGDVLLDVAFLAMDLERLGSPTMAAAFVDWYSELVGEHHPRSLVEFYVAYRSLVRAKVNVLRARQGQPAAALAARMFLQQCTDHLDDAVPMLVLIGGSPGTGKTTLAKQLAERLPIMVLSSDEVRKGLAEIGSGVHAYARPGEGIYSSDMTRRTYAELVRLARASLVAGESVVLDASWTLADERAAARGIADDVGVVVVEILCELDQYEAASRIHARMRTDDPSDATPEIAAHLRSRREQWPEAVVISTAGDVAVAVDAAMATCDRARRA